MSEENAPEGGNASTDDTPQVAPASTSLEQRTASSRPLAAAGKSDLDPDKDTAPPEPGKTFTQAELERVVGDRLRRERERYIGYDDLKAKAGKFDELEEAKKTEAQRLNDQLAARETELQTYRVAEVRREAAERHGLPTKWARRITAATAEAADLEAEELAADLEALKPAPAESLSANLQQGARPIAKTAMNPNDLLRNMAGHAT